MPVAVEKTDQQIQREVFRELRWDSRIDQTEIGVFPHGSGSGRLSPRNRSVARALLAGDWFVKHLAPAWREEVPSGGHG